jgi:hypothetical protein
VEEVMNKLIRLAVSGLSLCGVLAVLPGVAEAREPGRPVAGHVVRDRGHERGWFRGHDGRWEHREWRDGAWRVRHDGWR